MMIRVCLAVMMMAALAIAQEKSAAAKPAAPSLALTETEYNKLRIAELELTNVQQEQALLQARFKELQGQLPQLTQNARALYAEILKAHGAEGGQVDMQNRVVVAPPPKPEPPKEEAKKADPAKPEAKK